MLFADHLRAAIETAARIRLPEISKQLWGALTAKHITEAEAEELAALIELKSIRPEQPNAPQDRAGSPRTGRNGSRPRTDASMERRRSWAASGRMPPAIAARFTLAEQAVLSLVAAETCRRKDCRLAIDHIAALAGLSRSTVKNAIREAAKLGLLTVEERRLSAWRSDTNIVRIISREWLSWLRLARKRKDEREAVALLPSKVGGVKSPTTPPTEVIDLGKSRLAKPSQGLPRGSGRPDRKRFDRNRAAR